MACAIFALLGVLFGSAITTAARGKDGKDGAAGPTGMQGRDGRNWDDPQP